MVSFNVFHFIYLNKGGKKIKGTYKEWSTDTCMRDESWLTWSKYTNQKKKPIDMFRITFNG